MTVLKKPLILLSFTLTTLILVFLLPRIPQEATFHNFSDRRSFLGVHNAGNVLSNLPFLFIGIYGLLTAFAANGSLSIRLIYSVLFFAVLLTGLGSAYYHWNPNNDTIVWDRMPMTIVFMSFLCATVAELINLEIGAKLLVPLVAIGIGSVLLWRFSEEYGDGDLRLYFWVQFYPMLAIPLILGLYYNPSIKSIAPILIRIVIWYAIAKFFEQLDHQFYNLLAISGHTIKHLAAAMSTVYFIKLFKIKHKKVSILLR